MNDNDKDTDLANFNGPHVLVQVGPLVEIKPAAELTSGDEVRPSGLLTLVEATAGVDEEPDRTVS